MERAKRILVVGSSNTDIMMHVPRNPRSGESLIIRDQFTGIGGKGSNRAIALSRLGADVQFCCKLGMDAGGRAIALAYEREQLSTELILYDEQLGTGTAYVLIDDNGSNTILSYMGANDSFNRSDIARLTALLPRFQYLSLELECSLSLIEELMHQAGQLELCAIVDAGPARDIALSTFRNAYILSPNETEAAQLTGIEIIKEADAREACRKLYESGCGNVLLKRGSRGALLYDGAEFLQFPAYPAGQVLDTTAAGDCFMAALTYALTLHSNLPRAVQYANIAAGISVTRRGAIASLPWRDEVSAACARAEQEGYLQ
ncbi:ribokinase [Paenibacillus sp. S150]|uniref:ribokinase n=1 Tax=Paenibacillus sp. S150 TaxID=2749826 RepID=UPI001C565ACA|nr:ribokinase [Paenibacillus sp. S150]MBW4079841.1 ribokinase [Paenibacillus sp. S150]